MLCLHFVGLCHVPFVCLTSTRSIAPKAQFALRTNQFRKSLEQVHPAFGRLANLCITHHCMKHVMSFVRGTCWVIIPVDLLSYSQKCQGVPFPTICQNELPFAAAPLVLTPFSPQPHSAAFQTAAEGPDAASRGHTRSA